MVKLRKISAMDFLHLTLSYNTTQMYKMCHENAEKNKIYNLRQGKVNFASLRSSSY